MGHRGAAWASAASGATRAARKKHSDWLIFQGANKAAALVAAETMADDLDQT